MMTRTTVQTAGARLRRLVESARFNAFIVAVIVLNAVLIGLSTYVSEPGTLRAIG